MLIGCLQFAPAVGDVDRNVARANAVLGRADPEDLKNLDVLLLPEMALAGYNFRSAQEISPFCEEAGQGTTATWARAKAKEYSCTVVAGYPEVVVGQEGTAPANAKRFNAVQVISPGGELALNYRKSFLYYTDDIWASEGSGFYGDAIPGLTIDGHPDAEHMRVAMGICMDINPYKFEAPFTAYEFATHVVRVRASLVLLSMAWLTRGDPAEFIAAPTEPDLETLSYWVSRLEPLIFRAANADANETGPKEEGIVVVFCNRCGAEGDALYAGSSTVLTIRGGEVYMHAVLGRGEEKILIVDTREPPRMRLLLKGGRRREEEKNEQEVNYREEDCPGL